MKSEIFFSEDVIKKLKDFFFLNKDITIYFIYFKLSSVDVMKIFL